MAQGYGPRPAGSPGENPRKDHHVRIARDPTDPDSRPRPAGASTSGPGATAGSTEPGGPAGRDAAAANLTPAPRRRHAPPERLQPAVFNLPVGRLRAGYYSDAYFNLTKDLLEAEGRQPRALVQVFQRKDSLLGGVDEAIAVLKLGAGHERDGGDWEPGWDQLEVRALYEGDRIEPWEPVMTIEGDYSLFAHLETVYLGAMARRSLVMRNVRAVVEAAAGKPIMFFPARHDHWLVQTGDGWAAHVAGAIGVSTDAQASGGGGRGVGTVPHGLIAAYEGDTIGAASAFARRYAALTNITVLVDFDNHSAETAVAVAGVLGDDLWGVRLDTSGTLIDDDLKRVQPDAAPGVSVELARLVRDALDDAGHERVRIVASGGFDAERIATFESAGAPVDAYGVGSALLRGSNDFTADVVRINGKPCAKVGREERPSERLEPVS
jgi:nicotinate phosphoribosyltransferase